MLEGAKDRVLIDRAEYDALCEKVRAVEAERKKASQKTPPPVEAIVLSSDFTIALVDRRAVYRGTLEIESLVDYPIVVPLSCGNLRLLAAHWDEEPALLDPGRFVLLVPEKGRRKLTLQLVGPLQTDSTRQMIDFALPRAPRETLALEAGGDVELKSGAAVIRRDVEGEGSGRKTRFELLLDSRPAINRLVLSLNSHKTGQLKTVLARSVQFDEVAETYERLHATLSLDIPHQGINTFRVAVPEGFEMTDVHSPQLKRWTLSDSGAVDLEFRESQTGKVPITLSAIRTDFDPLGKSWMLPRFEPADVESHASVLGLLLDTRLNLGELAAKGLIPIELRTLTAAIPPTVFDTAPGAPTLRGVAAWYAPCGSGEATSTFTSPAAGIDVDSAFRLSLAQDRQTLTGRLTLTPRGRRVFEAEISVPKSCRLTALIDPNGNAIPFEPVPDAPNAPDAQDAANAASKAARFKIRFPEALPIDRVYVLGLEAAVHTEKWLDAWEEIRIDYPRPRITIPTVGSDTGSLAVLAAGERDYDITVDSAERAFPPVAAESDAHALPGFVNELRYVDPNPAVRLLVRKSVPRSRAAVVSFCKFESAMLRLHYEISYFVEEARTDTLRFTLPPELTAPPRITGLDGLTVKEHFSTNKENAGRTFDVRLAVPVRGVLRLAVDTQIPIPKSNDADDDPTQSTRTPAPSDPPAEITLPLLKAEGVAWQSDLVAIEGDEELDLQVLHVADSIWKGWTLREDTDGQKAPVGPASSQQAGRIANPDGARSVDVGELDACSYKPGKRLLGAWRPVPGGKPIAVALRRNETYALAGSVIDRVHAEASLGEGGRALVRTTYALRTKPVLLEVAMGTGDRLWSIALDGEPFKPQRNGNALLVDLPAGGDRQERTLEVLFDAQSASADKRPTDGATLRLPELRLGTGEAAVPIPVAQTVWTVAPPSGFRIVRLGEHRVGGGAVPEPTLLRLIRELFVERVVACRRDASLGVSSIAVPTSPYFQDEYGYELGEQKDFLFFTQTAGKHDRRESEKLEKESNKRKNAELRSESSRTSRSKVLAVMDEVAASEAIAIPPQQPSAGRTSALYSLKNAQKEEPARGRRLQLAQPVSIALRQSASGTAGAASFTTVGSRDVGTLDVSLRRASLVPFSLRAAFWGTILFGLIGLGQPSVRRWKALFIVLIVATLLVLVPGLEPAAPVFDAIAGAGLIVVLPLYIAVGFVAWLYGYYAYRAAKKRTNNPSNPENAQSDSDAPAAPVFVPSRFLVCTVTVLMILLFLLACSILARSARGEEKLPRIQLPSDAIVVPYDATVAPEKKLPTVAELLDPKQKILVPLNRWEHMLRAVDPKSPANVKVAPVFGPAVACSGLEYEAELGTKERLIVRGRADFTCRDEKSILLALPHVEGVFVEATVDGRPAVLGKNGLVLSGKGKHEVRFALQFTVKRQGGWRFVQGVLPSAPACKVRLTLPETGTDLLAENALDQRKWTTSEENETIETSTDAVGRFRWSWRTKISEAEVDHSLKVQSEATFDIQEDGYRLTWRSDLAIGRGRQEMFRFRLPAEYTVLAVRGENVRGFSERERHNDDGEKNADDKKEDENGERNAATKQIDVELLKPAEGTERITLVLFKPRPVYEAVATERASVDEPVPAIDVLGAAIQQGRLTVERSVLLDVRATPKRGLQLTDLPEPAKKDEQNAVDESIASPLERVQLQSYRFTDTAYRLDVAVRRFSESRSIDIESVLRLSEHGMRLESRIAYQTRKAARFEFQIRLPDRFTVEKIALPVPFEWSVVEKEDGRYLCVYATEGWANRQPLLVEGPVETEPGEAIAARGVPVPEWRHPGGGMSVDQRIAVLSDPAYDVRCDDPDKSLHTINFKAENMYRMKDAVQQDFVRCTLRATRGDSDRKELTARLRLESRTAEVWCDSINNVRPVEDAIEETILLDYKITRAGIRSVRFDLPTWLHDAKIETPLLRRKTVAPIPPANEGGPSPGVRVELELQESVMGQFRVLIAGDRPIKAGEKQTVLPPFLHDAKVGRQYIVFEQGGSLDQLAVLPPTDPQGRRGAMKISRGEGEWGYLAAMLGENMSEAYLVPQNNAKVPPEAIATDDPGRLAYEMIRRETLKLSDAVIGLAETVLAVGENGDWRMEQVYRIDNKTQQYLDVLLPERAAIWSAWIYTAGEWERRRSEPTAAARAMLGRPVRPCVMPESRIDFYRTEAPVPIREKKIGSARKERFVRIPIVKTELGDLDYVLRLVCAGESESLAAFAKRAAPDLVVLNITVERQTLRLFLPNRFDYWFDGSYNRDWQKDIAVTRKYYDEFQARRLEQAILQQDNPYAQARAFRNAGDLGTKLGPGGTSGGAQRYFNEMGVETLGRSGAVAQVEQRQRLQSQSQLNLPTQQVQFGVSFSSEIVDRRARPGIVPQMNQPPARGVVPQQAINVGGVANDVVFQGNRAQLESQFLSQRNDFATNVVTQAESNWKAVPNMVSKGKVERSDESDGKKQESTPASTSTEGTIRKEWFASNALTVDPTFGKASTVSQFRFVGDDEVAEEAEPRTVEEAISQIARHPYPESESGQAFTLSGKLEPELSVSTGSGGNITFHDPAYDFSGGAVGGINVNGEIAKSGVGSLQIRGGTIYSGNTVVNDGSGSMHAGGAIYMSGDPVSKPQAGTVVSGMDVQGGAYDLKGDMQLNSPAIVEGAKQLTYNGPIMTGGVAGTGSLSAPNVFTSDYSIRANVPMESAELAKSTEPQRPGAGEGRALAEQTPLPPAAPRRELSMSQGQLLINNNRVSDEKKASGQSRQSEDGVAAAFYAVDESESAPRGARQSTRASSSTSSRRVPQIYGAPAPQVPGSPAPKPAGGFAAGFDPSDAPMAEASAPDGEDMSDRKPESGFLVAATAVPITPMRTHFASLDIDIPMEGREYTFSSTGPLDLSVRCIEPDISKRLVALFWSVLLFGFAYLIGKGIARRSRKQR